MTCRYVPPLPRLSYHEAVGQFQRTLLEATLREHDGCRSAAARALGLSRTYFHRLIRALKIDVPARRRAA